MPNIKQLIDKYAHTLEELKDLNKKKEIINHEINKREYIMKRLTMDIIFYSGEEYEEEPEEIETPKKMKEVTLTDDNGMSIGKVVYKNREDSDKENKDIRKKNVKFKVEGNNTDGGDENN